MITQELTIKELRVPHSHDKRTLMLNDILNNIVGAKNYQKHNVFCEFRCNYPGRDYYFFIKTNPYNNSDILCESVYYLIEEILNWYDLSDIENFEVKFEEGNNRMKCTYYDLAWWGYSRSNSPWGRKPSYSDEKLDKLRKWMEHKMENEKKEYDEKMKRALGGGRAFCENKDLIIIHKPEGFIMKIKNKFVNLCHGIIYYV